ncbi:hypothetical protein BAY61_08630 [Prauserella marina]|uniref:Uncharacterized protein n=1 Tax=Prauserella marina TaxID=530584 RepID=A0A222VMQ9_9PSEU|nr:hypothetical protein [Prauserella marina]ASR35033.1 hypothetical protein BAY61_08630 [Prauserella marina]PWV85230.1 hypothetical protein DES30_1011254 [Prauserella marina]SDC01834.1 hypothetical protein SAMN05421630_10184 [Prauserella marina]
MEWVVVIEESISSGNGIRWGVGRVSGVYASQSLARQDALNFAHRYNPKHPRMDGERRIYRLSEDSYLVNVAGATSRFHFRVSVADRIQ